MKLEDIPKEAHYAVILSDSVHIPGDERSRTHPGHGYPASTHAYITYEPYMSLDEVTERIKQLDKLHRKYMVINAQPVEVSVKVHYDFGGRE